MINLPILSDEALPNETPRERFWRSLAHLKNNKDLAKQSAKEFMPEASATPADGSRRRFMQLMGASVALAGLSACRRPVEYIAPYSRKPEEIIPGIARYYATAMPTRTGALQPLLVESHEGRPTKVEGNPDHPDSVGTTDPYAQASVLNLYDPDRSRVPVTGGAASTWDDFVAAAQTLAARRIAIVAEPTTSPTLQRLRDDMLAKFPGSQWIPFSAAGDDAVALGTQQAFGSALTPRYDFSAASVIVSLDADFVGPTANNMVHNNRTFAAGRKLDAPTDTMSRLYVVESAHTTTGAMADHRVRLRACDMAAFGAALGSAMGVSIGGGEEIARGEGMAEKIRVMADDLRAAGSGGVVVAGEHLPPEAHALAAALNSALGSAAVSYTPSASAGVGGAARPQGEAMRELVQAMRSRAVDAVVFLGTNPAYNLPESLGFTEALRAVETSIHVGTHFDETAEACTWHVPASHYLEAWGDGRSADGTLTVIQPLIAPLHESKSYVEVVNTLATGTDRTGYDLVRETWRGQLSGDFEKAWRAVIHDGFLADTAPAATGVGGASAPARVEAGPRTGIELVFKPDPALLSGAFSNNSWMQELPDPVTKITWDNVAMMSPATAAELGVESEYRTGQQYVSLVTVTLGGKSIEIPAWVLPGHADASVTLYQGYGRALPMSSTREIRKTNFFDLDDYTDIYGQGAVASGVGVNVDAIRPASLASVATGATVEVTGAEYMIATTQDHAAIDLEKRPAVRKATYDEYRAAPAFARDAEALLPDGEYWRDYPELWDGREPSQTPALQDNPYYQNQWGMTIDLNSCTGCNACVVACQSENNIQVVGKDEVARGREMHWMRLDRYFVSPTMEDEDIPLDPQMVVQPVLCQHCENAPCESVCPVAATVHSPDGTNQMIYNRCIGTRYCANNCPYKVRRFNFFNWTHTLPEEVWLANNPNVTVRSRGVMEKCSFCIQRIREANLEANIEDRSVRDGDVVTACQQACPAEAITFGDLNDPTSAVAMERQHPRAYEMLAYLNVKPRVSYLARVTNPNPRFPVTAIATMEDLEEVEA